MISNPGLKDCKRILVIGCSGAGKSTFAKTLGKKLNLEVIHLDKYFHKPDWVNRPLDEFTEIVKQLVLKKEWIMEGNYYRTLNIRAPLADLIFFFDFPSNFCLYRVLKRNVKTKLGLEKRDDMPHGCKEQWVNWESVKFILNFKRDIIPHTYKVLEEMKVDKNKLFVFKSNMEFKKFMNLNELI